MQILGSGFLSLSGHLYGEMLLRVIIQQAMFDLGIYHPRSLLHGFIMESSACKSPHPCRRTFMLSSHKIILLDSIMQTITKRNTQTFKSRLIVSNRHSGHILNELSIFCTVSTGALKMKSQCSMFSQIPT